MLWYDVGDFLIIEVCQKVPFLDSLISEIMKFNRYVFILFFLLSPIIATAQIPSDVCYVWSFVRTEKLRGSRLVLGEISPKAFDELITKSFVYPNSKLIVTVSIDYVGRYNVNQKGKPSGIRIALAVSDNEIENAFDSVDNVVAETSYGKQWGKLDIEKQISASDEIYTFVASCEDGSKSKVKRK